MFNKTNKTGQTGSHCEACRCVYTKRKVSKSSLRCDWSIQGNTKNVTVPGSADTFALSAFSCPDCLVVLGEADEDVKVPELELKLWVVGVEADGTEAEEGRRVQVGVEVAGAVNSEDTVMMRCFLQIWHRLREVWQHFFETQKVSANCEYMNQ